MGINYGLDGKVAIVTGGGRGIGEAICTKLSESGATIVVADLALDYAEKVAEKLSTNGNKVIAIKTDVANEKEVNNMVEKAVETLGGVDILVNNAGILTFDAILDLDRDEWQRVMDINLTSTFLCTKKVLPYMIEKQSGKIVNLGSSMSSRGNVLNTPAGSSNYCVSKAAIQAFTRMIVGEHGKDGINANAVAPGIVITPMHDDHRDLLDDYIKFIPNGRLQYPEDVANAVAFLVCEEANYINGQNLHVNGGMFMVD